MTGDGGRSTLTAGDLIGVILAALATAGLIAFPLVARGFEAMYAEFGSPLPKITQLVIQPWFPPALALGPALGLVLALVPRFSLPARRLAVVAAFSLAAGLLALCVYAVYYPLYQVAEAVT